MAWKVDSLLEQRLMELTTRSFTQKEILSFMKKEFPDYCWSPATLKRRLSHFGIKRNELSATTPQELLEKVKEELNGPGRLLGYRAMHRRIRNKHLLKVRRNDVYNALNILDPQGLNARQFLGKKKRFHKRQYSSKGPNWVWSVDGHDKLMGLHKSEFPIGIHGCIDSFSRKIIWLRAWPSNTSPNLPARLYLEAIQEYSVVPARVRADRGNENVKLFIMQNFMRGSDHGDAFIYGSSTTNQVIERWWRDWRERHGNFFSSLLNKLRITGMYNDGNETDRVILAGLVIPILQQELNQFAEDWNNHRIRKQSILRPCGIPDFMYYNPEEFGTTNCGHEIDESKLQFLNTRLGGDKSMRFIAEEVSIGFQDVLSSEGLFPVKHDNLLLAYELLHKGCRDRGLSLKFST